jgi:hypothetical protein
MKEKTETVETAESTSSVLERLCTLPPIKGREGKDGIARMGSFRKLPHGLTEVKLYQNGSGAIFTLPIFVAHDGCAIGTWRGAVSGGDRVVDVAVAGTSALAEAALAITSPDVLKRRAHVAECKGKLSAAILTLPDAALAPILIALGYPDVTPGEVR